MNSLRTQHPPAVERTTGAEIRVLYPAAQERGRLVGAMSRLGMRICAAATEHAQRSKPDAKVVRFPRPPATRQAQQLTTPEAGVVKPAVERQLGSRPCQTVVQKHGRDFAAWLAAKLTRRWSPVGRHRR